MPVDDCAHKFHELTGHVFPTYVSKLRRAMNSPIPMRDFGQRGNGPATLARQHGFDGDISGCYVLIDGPRPVYVGISRHCFQRLLQHVRPGDHYTATLAYQMARQHYPFAGIAKVAMSDPDFHAQFDREREYILGLSVVIVEITNPLE